jgi:hypothetical protein
VSLTIIEFFLINLKPVWKHQDLNRFLQLGPLWLDVNYGRVGRGFYDSLQLRLYSAKERSRAHPAKYSKRAQQTDKKTASRSEIAAISNQKRDYDTRQQRRPV